MKFRHLYLFIILFATTPVGFSLDLVKFRRHEIGFNSTLLVKQFVNLGANNIPFSPYQVTYKYLTKKNFNLRLGAGLSSSKVTTTTTTTTGQNPPDPRVTKNYTMNYRLGFEFQNMLTPRWKCYYGADVTYDYQDVNTSSSSFNLRDKSNGFGAGPVLGIQYYFSDRISVFTELGFLYKNISSKTDITSPQNPSQNQSTKSTELSGNFFVPTTLFVAIKI